MHTELQRFNARVDLISEKNVAVGELILNPSFAAFWQILPLSTGSVHVRSPSNHENVQSLLNPLQLLPDHPSRPLINPDWLQFDFDFRVQVANLKFSRKSYSQPSLSTFNNFVELAQQP